MGTLTTFDFEGTAGQTISGAGITLTGTGSAVYDTGEAVVGTTGAKFSASDGLTRTARCTATVSSLTMACSGYVRTPAATPGANATIATLRNGTGVAMRVLYTTAGALQIQPLSGSNLTIATGVPLATKYRLELLVVVATSTTGTITAKAYSSAGPWTTQLGTTQTSSAFDLGTTAITQSDWGALTALTPGMITGVDYVRMEDGRTTEFGVPPTTSAPTVSITGSTTLYVKTGATVTLAATESGSITTATWSATDTTGAPGIPDGAPSPVIAASSSASTTAVVTDGGTYVFRRRVTGPGGTSNAYLTVKVQEQSNVDIDPHKQVGTTLWALYGTGVADIGAALRDSDPTTGAISPTDPAGTEKLAVEMNPAAQGVITAYATLATTVGTATVTGNLTLADGTTVLATKVWSGVNTTAAEYAWDPYDASALSDAQRDGIQQQFTAV